MEEREESMEERRGKMHEDCGVTRTNIIGGGIQGNAGPLQIRA